MEYTTIIYKIFLFSLVTRPNLAITVPVTFIFLDKGAAGLSPRNSRAIHVFDVEYTINVPEKFSDILRAAAWKPLLQAFIFFCLIKYTNNFCFYMLSSNMLNIIIIFLYKAFVIKECYKYYFKIFITNIYLCFKFCNTI